jgi:hypothetical protein
MSYGKAAVDHLYALAQLLDQLEGQLPLADEEQQP